MLRRRSQPDESNSRISFVRASKFINGVKNKETKVHGVQSSLMV